MRICNVARGARGIVHVHSSSKSESPLCMQHITRTGLHTEHNASENTGNTGLSLMSDFGANRAKKRKACVCLEMLVKW